MYQSIGETAMNVREFAIKGSLTVGAIYCAVNSLDFELITTGNLVFNLPNLLVIFTIGYVFNSIGILSMKDLVENTKSLLDKELTGVSDLPINSINYLKRFGNLTRTQTENRIEIQVEDQVESQVEAEVEIQVETQVETHVETQVETQVEVQAETQVETEVETQVQTEVETQVQTEVEITETSNKRRRLQAKANEKVLT
jgi:hypothetical protein